jgi:hypothetical protein
MTSFRSAIVVITLISLAGCGGGSVPVEGTLTLDGNPLAEATVTFQGRGGAPEDAIFVGETDSQGCFSLKSFRSRSPGAPPGSYRVSITTVKLPPNADERTILPPERVPPKYRDGSQGFEVPEQGTTEADFHITTR